VVTAVVGGILRDVVCNEIPLILKREIYATAAMIGAAGYCIGVALGAGEELSLLLGGVCAFIVRSMALIYGWSLPISERNAES
jgi:uncharacterized membrane protein YeiH